MTVFGSHSEVLLVLACAAALMMARLASTVHVPALRRSRQPYDNRNTLTSKEAPWLL